MRIQKLVVTRFHVNESGVAKFTKIEGKRFCKAVRSDHTFMNLVLEEVTKEVCPVK